jgi:ferredoxin-fold anticodon binding domain-containing protein
MKTVHDVRSAILAGNFTNDELNTISQVVQFVRAQLAKRNVGTMVIGTQVKFTNSRSGKVIQGRVEKVGRKNVIINTGAGRWRVAANMLEQV